MNRQRVTARQVLDFFVEKKYVIVPLDERGRYEQVAFDSAYRSVRRWLSEFGGYERGRGEAILYPLRPMLQRSTTTSRPSLLTEPSLPGRGSERCTQMRATSMNTITGMKTASGTQMTTKMSSTKRRSTKAVAIALCGHPRTQSTISRSNRRSRGPCWTGSWINLGLLPPKEE
jgi:hypothetical protein